MVPHWFGILMDCGFTKKTDVLRLLHMWFDFLASVMDPYDASFRWVFNIPNLLSMLPNEEC